MSRSTIGLVAVAFALAFVCAEQIRAADPPPAYDVPSSAQTFPTTQLEGLSDSTVREQNREAVISESGGVVSFLYREVGGGATTWDIDLVKHTLPAIATVTLTNGTDTVPVENWVWVEQDSPGVAKLGQCVGDFETCVAPRFDTVSILYSVLLPSAATFATDGAIASRSWAHDIRAHLTHLNTSARIAHGINWISGLVTTRTSIAGPDVKLDISAGSMAGLHFHSTSAIDSQTDGVIVLNDPVTPFARINTLVEVVTADRDANGDTLKRYFNLVVSVTFDDATGTEHLFINLPTCSSSKQSDVEDDVNNCAVYTLPGELRKTTRIISRIMVDGNGGNAVDIAAGFRDLRAIDLSFSGSTGSGDVLDAVHLSGSGDPNTAGVSCRNINADRYIDTAETPGEEWYCAGIDTWLKLGSSGAAVGAPPTLSVGGDLGVDTRNSGVGPGRLLFHDATSEVAITSVIQHCITIENLSLADIVLPLSLNSFATELELISGMCWCKGTCTTSATANYYMDDGSPLIITGGITCSAAPATNYTLSGTEIVYEIGDGIYVRVTNTPAPDTDTYMFCINMKETIIP